MCLLGFVVWENLLWHPIHDLRDLQDPNATEKGIQRPLDVAS